MGHPENLRLRPATLADSPRLLLWRTDAETRAQSWNAELVTLHEHDVWLKKTFANPSRRLLIAELDGVPVATVRADREDGVSELSWTIAPEFRGRGLGKAILRSALEFLGGLATARIKSSNVASQHIAKAAGMHLIAESDAVQLWSNYDGFKPK